MGKGSEEGGRCPIEDSGDAVGVGRTWSARVADETSPPSLPDAPTTLETTSEDISTLVDGASEDCRTVESAVDKIPPLDGVEEREELCEELGVDEMGGEGDGDGGKCEASMPIGRDPSVEDVVDS